MTTTRIDAHRTEQIAAGADNIIPVPWSHSL